MISSTRTARVILIVGAALAIAAPAASARPIGLRPTPAVGSGQGYQGTYRPLADAVQATPDVQDRVGTINQVTGIHSIPVATRTVAAGNSFDWADAAIGAGSVLSLGLIAAGALGLRGRRRMALGV